MDTQKKDGYCPDWIYDAILNEGNALVIRRDTDNTIFRYYNTYVKYTEKRGRLMLGGKLMHKVGPNAAWQK